MLERAAEGEDEAAVALKASNNSKVFSEIASVLKTCTPEELEAFAKATGLQGDASREALASTLLKSMNEGSILSATSPQLTGKFGQNLGTMIHNCGLDEGKLKRLAEVVVEPPDSFFNLGIVPPDVAKGYQSLRAAIDSLSPAGVEAFAQSIDKWASVDPAREASYRAAGIANTNLLEMTGAQFRERLGKLRDIYEGRATDRTILDAVAREVYVRERTSALWNLPVGNHWSIEADGWVYRGTVGGPPLRFQSNYLVGRASDYYGNEMAHILSHDEYFVRPTFDHSVWEALQPGLGSSLDWIGPAFLETLDEGRRLPRSLGAPVTNFTSTYNGMPCTVRVTVSAVPTSVAMGGLGVPLGPNVKAIISLGPVRTGTKYPHAGGATIPEHSIRLNLAPDPANPVGWIIRQAMPTTP